MSNAERIFTEIYDSKLWGGGSGGGSTPQLIPDYISLVERLLKAEKISSVLDIGCGFGWIAQAIKWGSVNYIGMECVPKAAKHAGRILREQWIRVGDALVDPLPPADLVLLKELLQHFDNRSVKLLLSRLEKYQLVLHCSAVDESTNAEIEMGETRGVDLSLEPFNLPCETVLRYKIGEAEYLCQLWRPNG